MDDISIHAPREGGDGDAIAHQLHRMISIHAPREGGDTLVRSRIAGRDISIHAPREGGDKLEDRSSGMSFVFQSTPPARGATAAAVSADTLSA